MKTQFFLMTVIAAFLMTSCSTATYFQVFKTESSENVTSKNERLVYEDKYCMVIYDFWSESGDIGFQFVNKSDENIYLNKEESFFILNGIANNYFKNRLFSSSTSAGAITSSNESISKSVSGTNTFKLFQTNRASLSNTIGVTKTASQAVSYQEEKTVCIPAHSSKIISEYYINSSLYRDCDLYRYPSRKQIKTKEFSKDQSPLVFSNRIVYKVGENNIPVKFENEFYVSAITNYPENEMYESRTDSFCGQNQMTSTKYFKNVSANKFYISYSKVKENLKH